MRLILSPVMPLVEWRERAAALLLLFLQGGDGERDILLGGKRDWGGDAGTAIVAPWVRG